MAETMKSDDYTGLSNTEELLINDVQGQYRDQLLANLFSEASRLKQLRDKGTDPDNFVRIDSLLTSIVAAMEVVDKNWKQHHKS
ncbi:hypothetical protein [Endozoicomonas ascidiicola]|uniref:hypothetical protein n=1 Tax=Endozoicomonas ascidiicola TaxID=1698521 RepID=UPI000AEB96B8|nr:hypothetical protein [Endozoicomonas ascidiicola]